MIYTKKGDKGFTSLTGGDRVEKDDAQVEAIGTLDELNAHLGLLASLLGDAAERSRLEAVQRTLFDIGARLDVPAERTEAMERAIDDMTAAHPGFDFVLPGGTQLAAQCHVCRAVCRRAERRMVTLARERMVGDGALAYLNRLSDYLFMLSRNLNFVQHVPEKTW